LTSSPEEVLKFELLAENFFGENILKNFCISTKSLEFVARNSLFDII
jgi:hypothetical protein